MRWAWEEKSAPAPLWAEGPSKGRSEGASARPGATADDARSREAAPEKLHCRRCGAEICDEDAVFSVTEGGAVQVFPNPGGWLRRIVTVRWARNLDAVSAPTLEFTWFAGYAWTIVACAGCGAHLGWRYEATANQALGRFYGLLVAELSKG